MASVGYGFAEAYVMRKVYKEKMKKRAQEEEQGEEERMTNIKFHTTKRVSDEEASIGCFSWVSKQQRKKNSRISDSNENEAATI